MKRIAKNCMGNSCFLKRMIKVAACLCKLGDPTTLTCAHAHTTQIFPPSWLSTVIWPHGGAMCYSCCNWCCKVCLGDWHTQLWTLSVPICKLHVAAASYSNLRWCWCPILLTFGNLCWWCFFFHPLAQMLYISCAFSSSHSPLWCMIDLWHIWWKGSKRDLSVVSPSSFKRRKGSAETTMSLMLVSHTHTAPLAPFTVESLYFLLYIVIISVSVLYHMLLHDKPMHQGWKESPLYL